MTTSTTTRLVSAMALTAALGLPGVSNADIYVDLAADALSTAPVADPVNDIRLFPTKVISGLFHTV